jgi:hypothetical protein
MLKILTMLLAFTLDAAAVYAGTRAILLVQERRPIGVANWGLMVNLCAGTTLLLAVFGDTTPVFLSGCAGAWVGDWYAVHEQIRREKGTRLDT